MQRAALADFLPSLMDWNHVARSGNIDDLYELFREDPCLLEWIDEDPFVDTPMHIAAAVGQVDFVMELMNLKPSFATKLNPDGLTPAHIAMLNHPNLLYELLKVNQALVRVKGKKGKTLLHYAAEQGDVDLLAKFLMTCPESITDVTVEGKTALHIAAERNQLEALQLLVRWLLRTHNKHARSWEFDVINWKNNDGNTVLHVAASNNHNQVEMIGLLLECDLAKRNVINSRGSTALDILQQSNANRKAIAILSRFGGRNASSIPEQQLSKHWRSKVLVTDRIMALVTRARGIMRGDTRNALLVVAALVLTTTYQALFNPPGGVRQVDAGSGQAPSDAGRSVMGTSSFFWFFAANTASFLITLFLTVLFLMVGPDGEPGEAGVFPLVTLVICYFMSAMVVSPNPKLSYLIWIGFGITGAFASWILGCHNRWILWARRYSTGPDTIQFNNVLVGN